eukprot:5935171-Heterocapsa_arctica.AAC.1
MAKRYLKEVENIKKLHREIIMMFKEPEAAVIIKKSKHNNDFKEKGKEIPHPREADREVENERKEEAA